jgi:hypothetical protein
LVFGDAAGDARIDAGSRRANDYLLITANDYGVFGGVWWRVARESGLEEDEFITGLAS